MRRVKNFTPIALAGLAFLFGTMGMMDCETVAFPQVNNGDEILLVGPQSYRTFREATGGDDLVVYKLCKNYKTLTEEFGFDYEVDARSRTVVIFSFLTSAIGGLSIFYYLAPCVTFTDQQWAQMRTVFTILCLFQGLTLLIRSSSICLDNPVLQFLQAEKPAIRETLVDECEPALGYKLTIVAVVLWFVAAASTLVLSPKVRTSTRGATLDYQSEEEEDKDEQAEKGNNNPRDVDSDKEENAPTTTADSNDANPREEAIVTPSD